MSVLLSLSTLAIRELVDGACVYVGIKKSGEDVVKNGAAVVSFLTERFTDHSQRLIKALHSSNEKAWNALEIALAGDSLWDRCKVLIARSEDKAFAQQVRAFLDAAPLRELSGKTAIRQKCLAELRAARKAGALTKGSLDHRQLAKQAGDFSRFGDPTALVDAEWRLVAGIATEMKQAGHGSLAWLLSRRSAQEMPVLVIAVRYFFRRAVEDDQKLFQGLAFAKLDVLGDAQEKGFAALAGAFAQQGQRLEDLLGEIKAVVVETHSAVLDLQRQVNGLSEETRQMFQAVMQQLEQRQLERRDLRPSDSLSIRGDTERQLVKQLVSRYRALPEEQREKTPALLNAIGKLEVVAGDFDAAQKDFQQVATLVTDTAAKAEAHFNAYHAALERRDQATALKELLAAVKLEAKRFAPFPVGKYQPQRILGAGGFGVAFLCRHKELKADVVVKTLASDDLGRDVDEVLDEARVLYQLDHPSIVRLLDCGYTIPTEKARPYFVMNFFAGATLEEYVQEHGPLSPEDLMAVARKIAKGLEAAHDKGILHRDVKPANILVLEDDDGWKVKIIDFGLALKQERIAGAVSTSRQSKTIMGSSIAGTLDYAAPEQMGRQSEAIGPYSDIYGFAKTCSFALFQTTQPLFKHWQSLPLPLAQLLEQCLEEDPKKRPQTFAAVLESLKGASCLEEEPKKRPQEFSQVPSQLTGDDAAYEKNDEKRAAPRKGKRAKAKRSVKKPTIPPVFWLVGAAGVMVFLGVCGGLVYSLTTGSRDSGNAAKPEFAANEWKAKPEKVAPPPGFPAKGRLVLSCEDRPVIRLTGEKLPPGVDGLGGEYYDVPPITVKIERIDCRGEVELRTKPSPGLRGFAGSSNVLRVPDGQSVAIWNLGGAIGRPDIGIHVIRIEAKLSAEPDVMGGVDFRVEVKEP